LTFDLGRVEWFAPFGLTILSATILACLEKGKACKAIRPASSGCRDYLKRIGFDALFLKGGEKALCSPDSVELRHLRSIDPFYVNELIQVLARDLNSDEKYMIQMQLMELMMNAQDHAESRMGFFVCAQIYPTTKTVRLSLVDVGRGISSVLRTLPKYQSRSWHNDADLILEATQPGVTTRKDREGGMGLKIIRRYLQRAGGTLTIISEFGKVVFQPKKIVSYNGQVRFPGTAVDILMKIGRTEQDGSNP
jgi:anti-sigma regulatory factor (Ser/Thr protein kinase)